MPKPLLEIITDLMRIPSLSQNPAELQRIVEYVETYFGDTPNLFLKKYSCNDKPSIVISTKDTLTFDILLMGHLDVVPADHSLFVPRQEGSILYGRGACDMKSEDALMMELLRELANHPTPPSVALLLTTDEEIGGKNGARYLIEDIGYRGKIALVPDGGDSPQELIVRNKGGLQLKLSFTGRSSHSSRPWLGENAIEKLFRAYTHLTQVLDLQPSLSEESWHTTCVLSTISAGGAVNQVPDQASCTVDIRFTEEIKRPEDLLQIIQQELPEAHVELLTAANASYTPPEHPYVKLYTDTLNDLYHLKPSFCQSHGGNDGRYLTALGIPVIVSRPRSGGQHSSEEWIDLDSVIAFKDFYRELITRFSAINTTSPS